MFFHLHFPQVLILHQEVQQSSLMPRTIMQPDHGERAFPNSSPSSNETASHISQVVLSSAQAQMSEQNLTPCSSHASRGTHTSHSHLHTPHRSKPRPVSRTKQGSGCEWLLPLPRTTAWGAGSQRGLYSPGELPWMLGNRSPKVQRDTPRPCFDIYFHPAPATLHWD